MKQQEVAFFNNLAKDWWNAEGSMKPLHRMNPVRVQYIVDRLRSSGVISNTASASSPFQGLKIIDIGCGAGLLTESLGRLGADVVGLDAADNNISMAISHARLDSKLSAKLDNNTMSYMVTTIENHVETNNEAYDIVCSLEVIEHVENPRQFVKMCTMALKPGGSLFMSTINKTPLAYLTHILGAEYMLRVVPVGTHHYEQFVKIDDLKQYLAENDVTTVDQSGMFYNPITFNWSLVSDTKVSYIIHAIKK
eukprot:gene5754-6661_t